MRLARLAIAACLVAVMGFDAVAPVSAREDGHRLPIVQITVFETVGVADSRGTEPSPPAAADVGAGSPSFPPPPVLSRASRSPEILASPLDVSPLPVTVTEGISLADSPGVLPPASLNVNETVAVSDSPRALPPVSVSVNETIAVSDSPWALPPVSLTVNETIAVSDLPRAMTPLSLIVNEAITVADSPRAVTPLTLTVNETITVADAPAVLSGSPTPTPPPSPSPSPLPTISPTPTPSPSAGLPISIRGDIQDYPRIVRDNLGNSFIVWQDYLQESAIADWSKVYVQKLSPAGDILWAQNGVPASPAMAGAWHNFDVAPDGAGGVFVVWRGWGMDLNGDLNYDQGTEYFGLNRLYAQRLNAQGATSWASPVRVSDIESDLTEPGVVSDGLGGVIVAWQGGYPEPQGVSNRDAPVVAAQRLTNDGNRLWGPNGRLVYEAWDGAAILGTVSRIQIIGDTAQGAILSWWLNAGAGSFLLAQRVSGAGTVLWASATNLGNMGPAYGQLYEQVMTSDGGRGAILAWRDYRNQDINNPNLYAQKVNENGAIVWQAGGVPVCLAPGLQGEVVGVVPTGIDIAPDGSGGAVIVWEDYRPGLERYSLVFAQGVNQNGIAMWPANGVPVARTHPGQETEPRVISDGRGGFIVVWQSSSSEDIYAQRLNAGGEPRLAGDVAVTTAAGTQNWLDIASDGSGGVVVVWVDGRNYATTNWDIYSQRLLTLPPIIKGDISGDGQVNLTDLGIVMGAFGRKIGEPGFDPRADLNGDGFIDIYDLVMIGIDFGKDSVPGAPVNRRLAGR